LIIDFGALYRMIGLWDEDEEEIDTFSTKNY
jgi:hypothetical protein